MTEPPSPTQAFLAALPDASRAEVAAHIALGKTNLAVSTLQQIDPRPDPRMITDALVVLAARAGVDLVCPMCGEGPASARDDYLHLPLCDDCSAKYMTSPCPDCGVHGHTIRENEGKLCVLCEPKRMWAALTQETRDEIDQAVAALPNVMAIKRIRELIRCDGLRDAIMLHNLRHQERSLVLTTWSCPDCGDEVEGTRSIDGQICPPCEGKEGWERLPQSVRDDVCEVLDAENQVHAFQRLRELVGPEHTIEECMRMVAYCRKVQERARAREVQ